MDKNTYETYEFLYYEAEHDQFFVVQDDGTSLLNRQIQVAQVQDVKKVLEDVQPCPVYGVGVSPQQFFVDVTNSDELKSVSDQFILPDGDNSLYTNSYLLQPSSSTTTVTEQMDEDVVDQFQAEQTASEQPNAEERNIDLETQNNKQENNFTEITLNDEQYQTLEQKGWILLECNDKIFVLNTLGLHDITSNDKLIQKLKNEIQNGTTNGIDPGSIKIENMSSQLPNLVAQSFTNQQDTVEFVIGNNEEQDEAIDNLQFVVNDTENEKEEAALKNEAQMFTCDSTQSSVPSDVNDISPLPLQALSHTSSIKIKTKFNFKDIPEKIVLGKTVNGKRLVARVVNRVTRKQYSQPTTPDENVPNNTANENTTESQEHSNDMGISEIELVGLIQQCVRTGLQNKANAEDLALAENVVEQLLRVPNLKSSLVGHNIIITKVKNTKDEFGVIHNRGHVALVTGHVREKEDSSAAFEHLPNLLMTIKSCSEQSVTSGNQNLDCIDNEKAICTIFHVHITETNSTDNVIRVSVTLNKRQLSINQMFYIRKRHPNTVYACSACASLFKSEEALKEHQDKNCLDADEMLTIDTDKVDMVDAYTMIRIDQDKSYSCTQCDAKFSKLYATIRHVKSHLWLKPTTSKSKDIMKKVDDDAQKKSRVYKCKMCRSTYFHPATLSKHIVARHIKVKTK